MKLDIFDYVMFLGLLCLTVLAIWCLILIVTKAPGRPKKVSYLVGDIVTHKWENISYVIIELTDYPISDSAILRKLYGHVDMSVTSTLNCLKEYLTNAKRQY